jgi:hypothetical protein
LLQGARAPARARARARGRAHARARLSEQSFNVQHYKNMSLKLASLKE